MSLHILGQKCPICWKKGLVIGADDGITFRPQGWMVRRLAGRYVACPHCGAVTLALLPEALTTLKIALRKERELETAVYYARPRKKKT